MSMNADLKKKIRLVFASIFSTLLILEIVLQIWAHFSPSMNYMLSREQARVIEDPRLGIRPHPFHPEHDVNGFRNQSVPKESCIVALGDSQTYVHKVQPRQAWPQQLEQISSVKVYNMAYGEYGPAHSLVLWPEAMHLAPKILIEALYFGNDFYDSYSVIYHYGQFPELRARDPEVLAAIRNAGNQFNFGPSPKLGRRQKMSVLTQFAIPFSFSDSALYGLIRAARRAYHIRYGHTEDDIYFADDWEYLSREAKERKGFWIYDGGKVKTIFVSEGRAAALDTDDVRIAEGYRIALETLRLMNSKARASHSDFFVLLLPTKELVFSSKVLASNHTPPAEYLNTVRRETSLRENLIQFLKTEGISYIDAWLPLEKALDSGRQPYSISADGHKNSYGHQVVAKTVFQYLKDHAGDRLQQCASSEKGVE